MKAIRNKFLEKLRHARSGKEDFEQWLKDNPSKSYKNFYAKEVVEQLNQGKEHATLGGNLRNACFATSGIEKFRWLKQQGLRSHHVFVDYGCGTLRVGYHIIQFLGPRQYWGFDISKELLRKGEGLIGRDLVEEKQPNLHVISSSQVEAAAKANPDFVLANAVLFHVHPTDFDEFFDNIMFMTRDNTKALVKVRAADKVIQYSGKSWDYPESMIEAKVEEHRGRFCYSYEKEVPSKNNRHVIRKKWMTIWRDHAVSRG